MERFEVKTKKRNQVHTFEVTCAKFGVLDREEKEIEQNFLVDACTQ